MVMIRKIFIISFLSIFIFSCAGIKTKKKKTVESLYNYGMKEMEKGYYTEARESFQKVKDGYSYSNYAILSELRIADSFFKEERYEEAIQSYEDFKELHPTSEYIPYVIYQIGMCNFKQMLPEDRDQSFTKKAIKSFEELIKKYPIDRYSILAKDKIIFCKERLAEHEFYIGYYYYKKKSYNSALRRFIEILDKYPSSHIVEKTLFYLGCCYYYINNNEKAKEAFYTLISQYPTSSLIVDAKKWIRRLHGENVETEDKKSEGVIARFLNLLGVLK
jgi:outer membrane protein assembly factor BamD